MLLCFGIHTITSVLRVSGRQFLDWTADYRLYSRSRIDTAVLFDTVRQGALELLPPAQPLVVGVDDSIYRKRGKRIPHACWQRDPDGPPFAVNWVWGQRTLQISLLLPCGTEGAARGLPIDSLLAPAARRPGKKATSEQLQAYQQAKQRCNINVRATQRLGILQQKLERERCERPLHVCVDGRFTNRTVSQGLPPGVTLIGRIRHDAKLNRLPGKRSRRRCYGRRLPTPQAILRDERIPFQTVRAYAAGKMHEFRVKRIKPVRWRPTGGQRKLQLIVIAPLGYRLRKRGRLLYRKPAYLICTEVEMALEQVLQEYLWRWEVEVNFRDEKTVLGVGQPQVRNGQSVENAPALQVAGYALLHLAAMRAYGSTGRPPTLPPPAWYRQRGERGSTNDLLNELRRELWGQGLGITEGFWDQQVRSPQACEPFAHPAHACCYTIQG